MAEKVAKMNEDGTMSIFKCVNSAGISQDIDIPSQPYTTSYIDHILGEIDKIKEDAAKAEKKIKKNLWKSGTYNRYGRRRR